MAKVLRLPREESRGLPEGMDPHKFYEYAIEKRSKEATGIEGLLYQILPWEVIRSFALAIDPFYQFKVSGGKITQANRTRYRESVSVLGTRTYYSSQFSQNCGNGPDPYDPFNKAGPYLCDPPYTPTSTTARMSQPKLTSISIDTTRRTRQIGSTQGEFENFKFDFRSPQRGIFSDFFTRSTYYGPGPYTVRSENKGHFRDVVSSGAILSQDALDGIRAAEKAAVEAHMSKYAISMYKGTNPQFRSASLFRDIAELKDLPRSVSQLRETLKNLSSLYQSLPVSQSVKQRIFSIAPSIKDIPKEYVSYHFGWKQIYRSILDVLQKPEKISRQIDFLIRRSGKATTYRSSRKYPSASGEGSPFATYDPLLMTNEGPWPFQALVVGRVEREIELKMVINTTFDFPTLNRPKFVHDKFMDKLGLIPRPTDLYNLVPWTWLVDWFSGAGNYIEIIDEINRDRSIINWGFLTGISTGRAISEHRSRTYNNRTYVDFIWDRTSVDTYQPFAHTSVVDFTFQLRKSLATVMDVKTTADVGSLTPYQQSILGSLLSQRINFRR
jgi:hypothetical protein